MKYSYRYEDGDLEEFDLDFPMGEAPDLIKHEGRSAKRVIRWGGHVRLRGSGWARHPEREAANRKAGPQDSHSVKRSFNP